jgi:hypothetical protein
MATMATSTIRFITPLLSVEIPNASAPYPARNCAGNGSQGRIAVAVWNRIAFSAICPALIAPETT